MTFRLVLAHLLPGFFPVLVFLAVMHGRVDLSLTGAGVIDTYTLFILSSITLGIVIDLLKHKLEPAFIKWLNVGWFPFWWHRFFDRFGKRNSNVVPFRETYARYDDKLKEAVRLWLKIRLNKADPVFLAEVEANPVLKKEYFSPTITSGDWFSILNVEEHKGFGFLMEEYFAYYEFSLNSFVSVLLTEALAIVLVATANMRGQDFWILAGSCLVLSVIFNQLSIFWSLATKRYIRKVLLYSLVGKDREKSD